METTAATTQAKTFQMYALVLGWVDGDTFRGVLDLGFGVYMGRTDKPLRCRCALVNAPEMSTPAGPLAKTWAEGLVPPGEYRCATYRLDEYGRPLVDLILPDGRSFSAAILAAGHAKPYLT